MGVWHYQSRNRLHALTPDEHGGNLPNDLGLWTLRGSVTLIGEASDEHEAISLVTEYGYCCFK